MHSWDYLVSNLVILVVSFVISKNIGALNLFLYVYIVCAMEDQIYTTMCISEWLLFYLSLREQFFNHYIFRWDDDNAHSALDQHRYFYSVSQLKQLPTTERHVTKLGYIIMIPSQPIFTLTPQRFILSSEAANTNFMALVWSEKVRTHPPSLAPIQCIK